MGKRKVSGRGGDGKRAFARASIARSDRRAHLRCVTRGPILLRDSSDPHLRFHHRRASASSRQDRGVFSDDSQKTPVKFHDEPTARAGYRPPRVTRSAVVVTSAPLDDQPAKLATSEGRILRRSPRDLSVCPDDRLPAPETAGRKSAKHVREKIFCSIRHSRFRPRFSPSKSPERTWKRDQIVLERTRCQNTRALRGLFSLIRLAILPVFAAIN